MFHLVCCQLCVISFVIFQCVSCNVSGPVLWLVRSVSWNMSRQHKQFRNKCLSWLYPVVAVTVPALLSTALALLSLLLPIKCSHRHSLVLIVMRQFCFVLFFLIQGGALEIGFVPSLVLHSCTSRRSESRLRWNCEILFHIGSLKTFFSRLFLVSFLVWWLQTDPGQAPGWRLLRPSCNGGGSGHW